MHCSYCNQQALFKCTCSKPYMCTIHLGIHYSVTESHPFDNLYLSSNNSKFQSQRSKLISELKMINQYKNEIALKTNALIKTIETAYKEVLVTLDNTISNYVKFLIQNEDTNSDIPAFYELEANEFKYETLEIDEITNEIKRVYSKNIDNSVKILFEMRTNFLYKHSGGFRCGVASRDSTMLVTGGFDSIIRVWDLNKNEQKFTLHGHDSVVRCLVLSNNDKYLISGSFDATVRIWDLQLRKQIALLKGHNSAVRGICYIESGSKIISGDLKGDLIIWDFNSHTLINREKLPDELGCLVLLKNESSIVAGLSRDIIFYDLFYSKITKTMKGHSRIVWCVCLNSDEKFMVSGSNDHLIIIWSLVNNFILNKLEGHISFINSVALTSDDNFVVSGSSDHSVKIWSLETFTEIVQFNEHTSDINTILNVKNNFLTLCRDSSIGKLDIASGELEIYRPLKHFNYEFACFEDDLNVVGYGSMDKACIWDFVTKSDKSVLVGHRSTVQFVEISKDGLFAISGSRDADNNLIYWDLRSNVKIADLNGHSSTVFCGSFSEDGFTAASGSGDKTVKTWDLKNSVKKSEFNGHLGNVYSIKFMNKKNQLASAGEDKKVIIWNLIDKTQYACLSFHNNIIWKIFVTEDENYLVSCEEYDGIGVWDLNTKSLDFMFNLREQAVPWLKNNKIKLDLVKKYLKP